MGIGTALRDLEVDRVDAVDRPATRRKFLIVKAEGDGAPAGDPASEAKRLLAAAIKAIGAIRKDATAGADLSDDVIAAANELREALGDEGGEAIAKAAKAPVADPPPADPPASSAPPAAPPNPAPALDEGKLASAIAEAVVKGLRTAIDEDEAEADREALAPPASSQPAGQEPVEKRSPVRKVGEGVFSDVIFGRTTRLGR